MQQLELENRRLTERAEEKEKTASEARADCDEARGALFQVEFLVFFVYRMILKWEKLFQSNDR